MLIDRDKVIQSILESVREGLPEYQAAKAAGISWNTFWTWKEADPGLYLRIEEAKKSRVGIIEDALYKSAMKGNVTAALIILRKESKRWRELLDGSLVPEKMEQRMAITNAAAAGAAAVIGMMADKKREKLRAAMRREGMIVDVSPAPEIPDQRKNGNGTNGNGAGPH